MGLLKDIEKLTDRGFIKIFCVVLFIAPGAAVIFHFKRDLFLSLDLGKLCLLSIAIVLPVFLIVLVASSIYEFIRLNRDLRRGVKSEPDFYIKLANSLLVTNGIYYFWLMYAYSHKLSVHAFITCVSFSPSFILIGFLIYDLVTDFDWYLGLLLDATDNTAPSGYSLYNGAMAEKNKAPTKKQFFTALKKVARKQKSGTSKTKT